MTYLPIYANYNINYYIAKVETYMFKHNKHEEEQGKKQKTNIIIVYFINDKEEKMKEVA